MAAVIAFDKFKRRQLPALPPAVWKNRTWKYVGRKFIVARPRDIYMPEVVAYIQEAPGSFNIRDMIRDLGIDSRRARKATSKCLERLVKAGRLARVGERRGYYRPVNDQLTRIVLTDDGADYPAWDIKLPLGLNRWTLCPAGVVWVIAGTPNAGKTALLLSTAYLNMRKHKINYFSCEEKRQDFRTRIKPFGQPPEAWNNVYFYERYSDYADVIEPDEINIIDYLDRTRDFFLVAEDLNDIHAKLKRGIAIVAMQMKPGWLGGHGLGVGGARGLSKPRLYLTVEGHVEHRTLTIAKCKERANPAIESDWMAIDYWYDYRSGEYKVVKDWYRSEIPEVESKKKRKEKAA